MYIETDGVQLGKQSSLLCLFQHTVNVFFSSKGLPCTLQAVAPLTARLEAFTETVQAPSPYFPQFYRRVSFTKHRFFYKLGVDPDSRV